MAVATTAAQSAFFLDDSPSAAVANALADNDNNDVVVDEALLSSHDFYNDDVYDYKDTFLHRRVARNSSSSGGGGGGGGNKVTRVSVNRSELGDVNENGHYVTGEEEQGEEEEGDDEEEDEEDDDDGIDFQTGGHSASAEDDDDDDDDDEQAEGGGEEEDETGATSRHFYGEDEDELDNEGLNMETFFKRVDSMELVPSQHKEAKVIKGYLMGELLGDGSYGKVKECLELATLARRAVKIINLKTVARKIPRGVENVRKEIGIMRRLEHTNLIRLYDIFEKGDAAQLANAACKTPFSQQKNKPITTTTGATTTTTSTTLDKPPKIYIFMDYCMTSLERVAKNAPAERLGNWQASFYFRQLVDGLDYLHSLNIIHNDIKPGNLLLTCEQVLKICDFSISAEIDRFCNYNLTSSSSANAESDAADANGGGDECNAVNPCLLFGANASSAPAFPISQCTPMFQCPEMLAEDVDEALILREATKIDVWSSGVTLYQLCVGRLPFHGSTIHQIFESIRVQPVHMPAHVDRHLSTLLLGMLAKSPSERYSLKSVRDSEWFRRKHPMIKEELTPLPDDVQQNESSGFRMAPFLQKYCEQQQQQQQQQPSSGNWQQLAINAWHENCRVANVFIDCNFV